jgi:hypothetical protein
VSWCRRPTAACLAAIGFLVAAVLLPGEFHRSDEYQGSAEHWFDIDRYLDSSQSPPGQWAGEIYLPKFDKAIAAYRNRLLLKSLRWLVFFCSVSFLFAVV